jgi:TRAP-type mannitol/chloroaromatic compound transport system permease small subunit
MRGIIRIIDRISVWTGKALSLLILFVVFVIIYEVVMRYCLNRPTLWAYETMTMSCAYTYVLGAAWVLKERKHVHIEVISERLSPRKRAIMDSFTFLFFLLYMGMLLWAASKYAWESFLLRETMPSTWAPPIYPLKIALAMGVLLLILQGTANFLRDIYLAIQGSELKEQE